MAAAAGRLEFIDDVISIEFCDDIALVTLLGEAGSGAFAWGTRREEHRWNPVSVAALSKALDIVEATPDACVLVVANKGKYWSNGMDLKYMDTVDDTVVLQHTLSTNQLMARLCCFPLPTVAAISGHWCAAGGMMGLAFDFRIMSSEHGFFFVPGVDLGLVYAPMQTALMKAKLPASMHRDVILFNSRRWTAQDLMTKGAIDAAVPSDEVLSKCLEMARGLRSKGSGPARKALGGLKKGGKFLVQLISNSARAHCSDHLKVV